MVPLPDTSSYRSAADGPEPECQELVHGFQDLNDHVVEPLRETRRVTC
jgi:hypothetical protein